MVLGSTLPLFRLFYGTCSFTLPLPLCPPRLVIQSPAAPPTAGPTPFLLLPHFSTVRRVPYATLFASLPHVWHFDLGDWFSRDFVSSCAPAPVSTPSRNTPWISVGFSLVALLYAPFDPFFGFFALRFPLCSLAHSTPLFTSRVTALPCYGFSVVCGLICGILLWPSVSVSLVHIELPCGLLLQHRFSYFNCS